MPTRRQCANAIRALAIDAIEKSRSGHPGAPLGMADMAEALWRHGFKHNPANPGWMDRDRFVLSNGHASMLLYAVLHLTGYDLSMDDIRNFRQLGSRTPGHPECDVTPGVEMTTGPLGQGISSAVGMALAEKMLATRFNTPEHTVIDHHTYVFLGDGCLMEGVSHEACSLAGVWGLGKLIALYDSNGISIDGKIDGWFTEDVAARYKAYGWQVIGPVDGHDAEALDAALAEARADHPSLIICKTHIGFGSSKADSASCHGSPLGVDVAAATCAALEWHQPAFSVPDDIAAAWDAREAGKKAEAKWQARFDAYRAACPEMAAELERRMKGDLPADWADIAAAMVKKAVEAGESIATRVASKKALEELVGNLPEMLGGSADLTGSVGTKTSHSVNFDPATCTGNYLAYGVREFGMSAIQNGIALYGGFIPYSGTFLTFSDYARNAIRMAALMKLRSIFVYTHDSIGLGEDGPTHQSIEHVSSLRLIPNLDVWRPADTVESVVAWSAALERRDGPAALIFTRQNCAFVERDEVDADAIAKGGYIAAEAPAGADKVQAVIVATGSEVELAMKARALLTAMNVQVRVVSMPCCDVFDRQDAEYRNAVLPSDKPILAVEAGTTGLWHKYLHGNGDVLGIDTFGESAPASVLWKHFGFTPENCVQKVLALIAK